MAYYEKCGHCGANNNEHEHCDCCTYDVYEIRRKNVKTGEQYSSYLYNLRGLELALKYLSKSFKKATITHGTHKHLKNATHYVVENDSLYYLHFVRAGVAVPPLKPRIIKMWAVVKQAIPCKDTYFPVETFYTSDEANDYLNKLGIRWSDPWGGMLDGHRYFKHKILQGNLYKVVAREMVDGAISKDIAFEHKDKTFMEAMEELDFYARGDFYNERYFISVYLNEKKSYY